MTIMHCVKIGVKWQLVLMVTLVFGILLRLTWISVPGTGDVAYFKGWSLAAADLGVAGVYPPFPPELDSVLKQQYKLPITYPPMTAYYLWCVGKMYRYLPDSMQIESTFNALVKLPSMIFELFAASILFLYVRKKWDIKTSLFAFMAIWLNPALIIAGSVMGYQDGVTLSLCLVALIMALEGRIVYACVIYAVALLTKQLALFMAPVLVVYCALKVGSRKALIGVFCAEIVSLIIHFPYLTPTGRLVEVYRYLAGSSIHHSVSANALNIWWIYTFIVQILQQWHDGLPWLKQILAMKIVYMDSMNTIIHFSARISYIVFTIVNIFFLVRRNSYYNAYFFAAAMQFYGYFLFMTGVHENHLLYMLVFMAPIISVARPIKYMYYSVSAIAFLNLFLFYGPLGNSEVRQISLFPILSLLLSVANVLAMILALYLLVRGTYLRYDFKIPYAGEPLLALTLFTQSKKGS